MAAVYSSPPSDYSPLFFPFLQQLYACLRALFPSPVFCLFFYPESASYNPGLNNEAGTLMVLVPFKQQDLRWLKEILYNEKRVRKGFWKPPPQIWLGDVSQIRVLDPHFLHQTAEKLLRIPLNPKKNQNSAHPTTGILAIFVALNYCDVVHIAGFGYPISKSINHPIHYYGYDTMKSMKHTMETL
nr:CMP-N-acetylneuraminate-beta-galactosamide-alpha-2,3-sialyltransferase 4-like [Nerophis lumbriciformis]